MLTETVVEGEVKAEQAAALPAPEAVARAIAIAKALRPYLRVPENIPPGEAMTIRAKFSKLCLLAGELPFGLPSDGGELTDTAPCPETGSGVHPPQKALLDV